MPNSLYWESWIGLYAGEVGKKVPTIWRAAVSSLFFFLIGGTTPPLYLPLLIIPWPKGPWEKGRGGGV